MTVSQHLNSLVSDIKKILPNDISKDMAFLLEKFPEDFIEGLKENTNLDTQAAIELTNKLFYLLSDEPETIQWRRNNLDFKPKIIKHKRRANTIYAPKYPRLTLLGSEFGEEIRKASTEIGGDRTVRPHIRRAHWHTFLCGIGRSQRKIRWIKPVFVHSRDMEKQQ